jgi:hypothetical protein
MQHTYGLPRLVTIDSFIFLCVSDVRTPQEPHVWASKACYGDGLTFSYLDDVRTSHETHL